MQECGRESWLGGSTVGAGLMLGLTGPVDRVGSAARPCVSPVRRLVVGQPGLLGILGILGSCA